MDKSDDEIIAELFRDISEKTTGISKYNKNKQSKQKSVSNDTAGQNEPECAETEQEKRIEQTEFNYRMRIFKIFKQSGFDIMSDTEVVEMLLFYVFPKGAVNELAARLINTYGSLNGVVDAEYEELCGINGMTWQAAQFICFMRNFVKRYTHEQCKNNICLDSVTTMLDYCRSLFIGAREENLICVYFGNEMQILGSEIISSGTDSSLNISIRTIAESVMRYRCSRVLLTHNHYRGSELPSRNDRATTRIIHKTLASLNIELIDHVVVGSAKSTSMRSAGYFDFI